MSTPRDPGLDRLVMALTTDGHPSELAGRDAALAAFRSASQSRRARRRNPLGRLPARLAVAVAAGAAALAGVTAAAYAQALPAPMQQIAHSVLAPLGVPDSQQRPAGTGGRPHGATPAAAASTPVSAQQESGCPCPAATSAAPSPTTTGRFTLTLSAARARLPGYAVDVFTGRVTRHGHAAAGISVRLLERTAATMPWRVAARGKSGKDGGFVLLSPRLTTSAAFLVAGPGNSRSTWVTVAVGMRVRLRLVTGKVNDRLIVVARAARPGDIAVLEELVGGSWATVGSRPLGAAYQASFAVAAKTSAARHYRGEVLIAGFRVPSAAIWVPRAKHTTGATIIGGPSTSPSPSPDASATPSSAPTPTAMPSPTISVTVQPSPADSTTPAPSGSAPTSGTPEPTGPPEPTGTASAAPAPTDTGTADPTGSPAPSTTSPGAGQETRYV